MSTSAQPLRIAIIGGGLGGLTLALTLAREKGANIQVTIYEAAAAFAEIGAGISIGRNAWHVFDLLGLSEAYAAIADFSEDQVGSKDVFFEWRQWDTNKAIGQTLAKRHSYVHRARLLDLILAAVPNSVDRKFKKRLSSFEQTQEGVDMHFEDGTSATADCVIGCDGIKSALRSVLHPPAENGAGVIRYSGSYAYRGLIDAKPLVEAGYKNLDLPRMYLGPSKHLLSFSVDRGKTVNVVAFASDRSLPYDERKWEGHPRLHSEESPAPWVIPVDQKLMLEDFEGWNEEIQVILQHIPKPTCWSMHELTNLNQWAFGKIALMGDAASATTPHQGSGASQALESGYVLGKLLAMPGCTRETVAEYLKVYEAVRKERHDKVKDTSREFGEVLELCGYGTVEPVIGKPLAHDQSEQGWQDLADELSHRCDWIFNGEVEDAVKEAQVLLKQKGL